MTAAFPFDFRKFRQFKKGFVNQSSWLKCVIGAFLCHQKSRTSFQFLINNRQQTFACFCVAFVPIHKNLRNFQSLLFAHKLLSIRDLI